MSLSQLLDVVEKKLDNTAAALSLVQIDNAVSRISGVLRKARSIKNYFSPINRIPPETLALAATFLEKQRDVINATAVCQQWRATLLSFPQVWRKAGGSSSELEAYLERSKSVPIEVDLSYPRLVASIAPHASRLEKLTVSLGNSTDLELIVQHIRDPIPKLQYLKIFTQNPQLFAIQPPDALFLHINTLCLYGISSFQGSQSFPNVTDLFLLTGTGYPSYGSTIQLLDTLEQLPGLVRVCLLFQQNWHADTDRRGIVVLPCVEEIALITPSSTGPTSDGAVPPILRFLELPKATIVSIQSPFPPYSDISIFPDESFGERLPNYTELPELSIETKKLSGEIIFRSASKALLTYNTGRLKDPALELQLWGALPISSVRRVTANQLDLRIGREDVWLVGLLGKLESLELVELSGDCGHVLRRLRHRMVRGVISISIDALIIRGGAYAKSQGLKFESIKDIVGLGDTAVTYIPDPGTSERYSDYGSQSEGDTDSSDDGYSEDGEGDGGSDEDDGDEEEEDLLPY